MLKDLQQDYWDQWDDEQDAFFEDTCGFEHTYRCYPVSVIERVLMSPDAYLTSSTKYFFIII